MPKSKKSNSTKHAQVRQSKTPIIDLDGLQDELRSVAMFQKATALVANMPQKPGNIHGIFTEGQTKRIATIAFQLAHDTGTALDAEMARTVLRNAIARSPRIDEEARKVTLALFDRVFDGFATAYADALVATGVAVGLRVAADAGASR